MVDERIIGDEGDDVKRKRKFLDKERDSWSVCLCVCLSVFISVCLCQSLLMH